MTFGWPQTVTIVMALVLLPVSAVVRSDEPVAPSIEQQPLFEAGKDGYFNYRIPSLVVTSRGTVLALCEARKKTGHDWDDVDLALRRSTDHGRTWSKMQIIADEGELTINQPCPVVDHQTGTIWLPLCRGSKPGLGNAEVLLMKSTDDGQTWSRPVSIHQSAADPSWTFVGTGPGHGIQLKSGRLLIPCWFDLTPTCGEVQSSCCIYSDDHGETWKRGEPLTPNACDECDIVELEDGTVYLNARSRGQKQRAYAFSKDGGQSWSAVQYDPQQPEPSCDGALIRLSDSRRMDKNRVLVACPTNPDTRAHIRVRMSYNECRTWPIVSEPLAHLGGYSDLAVTGDRQILCLYETWPSYKEFGENRTNLVLAAFNVEWLSAGKDTLAAPRAANPVSFRSDEGTELKTRAGKETAVRVQERSIPPIKGELFVYASFDALRTNPEELVHDEPQGMQTVAIGHGRDGDFSPCVSFGVVKDTHSGLGKRALLLPWLSDGKLDYFGMFARPQTPYDFKVKLDLAALRMTVWVSGRGDDDWFLLAENVPLEHPLESIRFEQNAGAPGVSVAVQSAPWPEAEQVRPHPQPKERIHVMEDGGFTYQSMRSTWRQPGKQVTIARNNPKNTPTSTAWLGFPDVLQVGPKEFLCSFTGGAAHGGGGPILVSRSEDLGQTWSPPVSIHPSGVNCSRIQKLNDGSILVLADVSAGTYCVVFYRSTDGGRTWEKIGYLDPPKVGGHGACVPSRVAEMPDGSWLIVGSWCAGNPLELKDGEQLELYRSTDRGATWALHSIVKEYPRSLSEASFVQEPGGKLWMFIREACRILPGVKTWSEDGGKTWARCEEMPFPIVGRTCAAPLKDGRILLTTRHGAGRAGLWAWFGDLSKKTQAGIVAAHFNDAKTVGLKDGELHLDNDGLRGQFTQYYLRAPDSPDSKLDITAEVKVVSNQGYAATLSIPYVGKLRILEDRVVMAHDSTLTATITPGVFHTYRVLAQGGKMTLSIDGVEAIVSDKADHRVIRSDWTPLKLSPYLLAFGNEPTFLSLNDLPPLKLERGK